MLLLLYVRTERDSQYFVVMLFVSVIEHHFLFFYCLLHMLIHKNARAPM